MGTAAALVLALFMVVAALVTIARRRGIAYPIFLVIGGLLVGLVPGLPRVHVESDFILLLVLPPILYTSAFFTPLRSLRANLGVIASLAVGLVVASAVAAAGIGHWLIPGLTWAAAFALGAIVAPPDAIAATAVAARLALPRRIVSILEGESLLNDATALTLYGMAIAAAVRGFSPAAAVGTFAAAVLGGGVIGLVVGWVIGGVRRRLDDTPVEITISLLTPYAAYLPAEALGVSGVIATVVTGLYLGGRGSEIMGPDTRLTGRAVWETVTFLLNGFVFLFTGLEVPLLLGALARGDAVRLVAIGIAITAALTAVRALWMLATLYLPCLFGHADRPTRVFAHALVLSWSGMRGVVSLAVALALPALPGSGAVSAGEALLVITLTVIVLTLVGQGLTLPWLVGWLRLGSDTELRDEELLARQQLVDAATRRIDELYSVWPGHHPLLDQLRGTYRHRSEHVDRQRDPSAGESEDREFIEHREIRRTVIDAEREALLRLRADGVIDDDVLRKLERELDLEEQRMDA